MSESRRGRERNDLKSATLCPSCLTGKEEVFAAVPEGLFTELLCAVTAAAEVKGMDLGLGIKAGCSRARRAERLRADEDDGGEPQTGSFKNSAGSRRIFRPKLDEGSSAGGRRERGEENRTIIWTAPSHSSLKRGKMRGSGALQHLSSERR